MTPAYRTILVVERPPMANEVSVMIMTISGVITSVYSDRLRPFDAVMPDVINSGIHALLMDPPTRINFTINSTELDSKDMFATLEDAKSMAKECVKKLQKKTPKSNFMQRTTLCKSLEKPVLICLNAIIGRMMANIL